MAHTRIHLTTTLSFICPNPSSYSFPPSPPYRTALLKQPCLGFFATKFSTATSPPVDNLCRTTKRQETICRPREYRNFPLTNRRFKRSAAFGRKQTFFKDSNKYAFPRRGLPNVCLYLCHHLWYCCCFFFSSPLQTLFVDKDKSADEWREFQGNLVFVYDSNRNWHSFKRLILWKEARNEIKAEMNFNLVP